MVMLLTGLGTLSIVAVVAYTLYYARWAARRGHWRTAVGLLALGVLSGAVSAWVLFGTL